MKIFVDIGHPAQVHFFKHFVAEMSDRGHEILVTARDKDVSIPLLTAYGIQFKLVGQQTQNSNNIWEWLKRDIEITTLAHKFRPDVMVGLHNPCIAHAARLTGAKSVIFTDTEHAALASLLTFPVADFICTPECFHKNLGIKHTRFSGYKELAYLHPNRFVPDSTSLEAIGITKTDTFSVIRLVAWRAVHDTGQHGLSETDKLRLVRKLLEYGRVFVSSESPLPSGLESFRLDIPAEKLHDVLSFATLCVSEGGSTATEAALLGTPSIHISTTANRCGNFGELQNIYKILFATTDSSVTVRKAIEYIEQTGIKREWGRRRDRMLAEKSDVTSFMVEFITRVGNHEKI